MFAKNNAKRKKEKKGKMKIKMQSVGNSYFKKS